MSLSGTVRGALTLVLVFIPRLYAQVADMPDSVMRRVTLRVAELDVRRQLSSATPATIDSLLAYYSDSVVYEHPNVGAVVRGKAALRAGMLTYWDQYRSRRSRRRALCFDARTGWCDAFWTTRGDRVQAEALNRFSDCECSALFAYEFEHYLATEPLHD